VQDAILKIVVKNKGVLNNDHDIDGDSLTAVLDSTVKYGKLEFKEDGTFTYTPADGWRGTDYFYYHVVDDSGATSVKTKVTINVVNKEQPVSIGFENTESSVLESDGTQSIRVSLSAAMSKAVIVDYAVTGGSAESPDDYTLKGNGQLVFNEGDLVQDILISIKDDTLHEDDKTIIITLSNSSSGVLIEDSIHTVTIIDNEMPGVFFDPESISVTEQDTTLLIMVKLQYPPRDSAVVTWSVTGGTATKGEDYNCNEKGKLVFRADETEKTIPLMIKDDSFKESSETIEITLTEAAGAVVSSKHVFICGIIDNDELPEIGFRFPDSSGTEDIQLVLVDVILSSPAEDTVYVDYYVDNNSTAVRDEDYKLSDGTLVFKPGDTLKSITIEIIQDAISEPDETVIIKLKNSVNAEIGSLTYTYTIKGDPSVFFKTTSGSDEEKNRTVAIPVILSYASQDTVKVDYKVLPATTDGAVKGEEFELDDGTLIFNPGDISDTLHLKILDDNYYENDENLIIELKNAKNAMIKESAKEYVYTIKNDDLKPKIGFGTTSETKNENNEAIEIDVVLSDTSALEVSVEYTFGGSADSGSDYTFIGDNPLVFAPFEMSKKLSMIIIDDGIYESRENIIITLGPGAQNADISTSSGVYTLIIPGDRHNVTVTSTDGGSVDISGTQEFAHDTVIAISPTAESNYQFVKWEYTQSMFDISGSDSDPNATFKIKGPGSIKAVFAINNFNVTRGTIEGSGEIEFDPPDGPYPYGTELIVTAKPEDGFKLDKWGGALSGSKNPDTLIIDENKTIRATFIRLYTLTVAVAGGQGSVTPEAGEYLYGAGEVVTLTRRLPSAPGWRFVDWSGDVSGNDSTISVTMSEDRNVTATFEKIPVPDNVYCVNSSAEGSRTGTNWADAFTTIEEALEAEENSATVNTVWVAEGEYLPSDDSFFPKNGCTLLGGFEGNESTHSQAEKREWYNNITTLNGKNVNYLIDLYGNSNVAIEGFKLIKSMKNAIYINESKVTVNNCIFTNNGTDNATSRTIYITGDSTKILNCIFTNNLGLNGSCIYTKGKNTIIGNTVIFNNSGPAIVTYVTDTLNQTKIINCSIIGNKSSTESGGINNTGLLTLINCIIYYNTGISTSGTQINKTNATQFCNIEDADGGGIGKKDPGYFPNNISTDPLFESLSMPSLDNIWFDPTDNNHALVPGSESSSKSTYGLSEFSEPTKYVKKDIRNRTRSSTYFMGAYERY
ncbi:MAG: cadherin-like domain-containing protein, partial [Fibrobacter sp.]|nr:cadherin-like domain-containing protein [Fibrobacter sp.]